MTYSFLPKLDYLPGDSRNLIFGFILPPPGYNLDTMAGIAEKVEDGVRHLWADDPEKTVDENGDPTVKRFFFAAFRANAIAGAAAMDGSKVRQLVPVMQRAALGEPGTFGFFRQRSIFGRGVGGSRSIDVDISGGDLEDIVGVAQQAFGMINQAVPNVQMRPRPALSLGAPEVRLVPNRVNLADNGVTATDLGQTVDAFNDGLRVSEITVNGERIDLTLMGPFKKIGETQGIGALPVVTGEGMIVQADALADVVVTSGPTEIRRREGLRTVTLVVTLPDEVPLEEGMITIQDQVIDPIRAQGIPDGMSLRLSGTADS